MSTYLFYWSMALLFFWGATLMARSWGLVDSARVLALPLYIVLWPVIAAVCVTAQVMMLVLLLVKIFMPRRAERWQWFLVGLTNTFCTAYDRLLRFVAVGVEPSDDTTHTHSGTGYTS